jgi:hypothetical protein
MWLMKKLLLTLALLSASAFAQNIDIPINTIGPIRDIARNVAWAGNGQGNLNNNYLFTPSYTNEGLCLSVQNNNPTSSHVFTLQAFGTTSQTVRSFAGNSTPWSLLGPLSNLTGGTATVSISANSSKNYFVQASGQAQVALIFTNGGSATGSPDTVTVTMVESQNGQQCGNLTTGPVYCPLAFNVPVAASTASPVLVGVPNQGIYVCNVTISASTALATGNVTLEFGSSTCTAPTTFFTVLTGATSPLFMAVDSGNPLTGRFLGSTDFAGSTLCVANNQTTPIEVDLSVAQF